MPAVTIESITIEPGLEHWPALLLRQSRGEALGRSLDEWRGVTREELNLAADRPVIAAGHQPVLWHPGILAKYIAGQEAARRRDATMLNVFVTHDLVNPFAIDVPLRMRDGMLASRSVNLAATAVRDDVPIVAQPAVGLRWLDATGDDTFPFVREGLVQIHAALSASASQENAAAQMMLALSRLMTECAGLGPMESAMASSLMSTSLGWALLRAMADDPRRCAQTYNAAVASEPEARLTALAIRDDIVELPLWRLQDDGVRLRGWDSDVEAALEEHATAASQSRVRLMPRALLMTAMLRLAACDLFIHGTGGAIYDRATEGWMRDWLGVEIAPMATVTATLHLPLMNPAHLARLSGNGLVRALNRKRLLEHDPEATDSEAGGWGMHHPGPHKQRLLREIDHLPARSHERRQSFFEMHRQLAEMRRDRVAAIDAAHVDVERLQRLARDAEIALRRDWAFPLYPRQMLMELTSRIHAAAGA